MRRLKEENYINERIKRKLMEQEVIVKKIDKYTSVTLIALASALALATLSVFSPLSVANIYNGLMGLGIIGFIHAGKEQVKTKNSEKKVICEIMYLSNLRQGISTSEEIRKNNVSKLLKLTELRIKAEKKYDNASTLTIVSTLIAMTGTIAAFANIPSADLYSGLCYLPLLAASAYEISKQKDSDYIDNRINDLMHKLALGDIHEEATHEETKEKVKTEEIIYQEELVKDRPKVYQKINKNIKR